MPAGQIIKLGWDRPLDIDWDFHLADLRRSIRDRAPGGRTGALKSAFDSPDTAVISDRKDVITIEVGQRHKSWRYAAIQEHGGYIRAFNIRTAQRMYGRTQRALAFGLNEQAAGRALSAGNLARFRRRRHAGGYGPVMVAMIGGALRFFTKRRGFHLVGLHYVENGVWDWWYKLKRGLLGNVPVWRSKHYAQRMQTRGRIS